MKTNNHPVYDPAWARDVVRRHYATSLELAPVIIREGCDLLMRAHASAPKERAHEVVTTVLYRQVLSAADAAFACLEAGAVEGAEAHLRQLLEARWGLSLALRDPAKWGLYVHVATLRANRADQRRHIEGTPEWDQFAHLRAIEQRADPSYHERRENYQQAADTADALLGTAPLDVVNAAFDVARGRRPHDMPWYCDGYQPEKARLTSIRKLAEHVGALDDYDLLYRHGSRTLHGGYESGHRVYGAAGEAVAPLRTIEGFRPCFMAVGMQLLASMLAVVDGYRTGERPEMLRRMAPWQEAIMATKHVTLEIMPVGPLE